MDYLQRLRIAIGLRIDQELVILRYALHCCPNPFAQSLFFIRIGGFFLTLVTGVTLVGHLVWGKDYLHPWVYYGILSLYLFWVVNTFWERGRVDHGVFTWQRGFVLLFLLQSSLLFALTVVDYTETTTLKSFSQVRATTRTISLPSGVQDTEVVGLKILSLDSVDSIAATQNVAHTASQNVLAPTQQVTPNAGDVEVVGRALNYPNPCRLGAEGTTIGYYLSTDAPIEIRIYDPFAREIYRESFLPGWSGGRGGNGTDNYNRVSVTSDKLRTSNVPAGIYYFLILNGSRVLARGKIAALP